MASPLAHLLHGDSNLSPRTPPALNTGASNVVPLIVPNSGASLAPPSTTTSGAAQASSATPPALPPQAPRSHANTASLYQCADCLRRYSRPEHLQRHIATHTLGKRFQCDVCGKLFSRADLLKRHRANHDNDNGTKRRRINSSPGAGRVAHACQACARARVKCEDLKPCTRCRNRNLTCEYASSEAGSAAAMHLLHLSANAHSNVNAPPPSSSDQDSPQSPYYPPPPAAQHQAPAVLPHNLPTVTLVIKTANESPVLTTNNHPLNPEEAQLPTPETMMDQSNPDNFQAPYPAHNVVDMARLPFSDFLRDVLYEPSGLEAQGIAALDYFLDSNENLELNDIDFGLLDHWNVDGMTDRATGHQGATWHTDDINDMSKMRQRLVKIWTESPWRWNPNKLDSGYVEQSNLPLPSEEASVAKFRESRKRLDRTSKERLESSSRDKILAIVLSTCRNNSIMTRVASSFPSVDVMDFLIQNFLASHMCQVTQWIHFGSLTLNSQWPEWLGAAAAAGAVLTPVQTLRKFGFALQEAVRITIPSRFEDANSTIGDPGAVGALILLQDIGLWSGNRRKMEISESHLSIPIAMMRYRGKFHRSTYPPIELAGSDEGDVLEAKFKSFYQAETWKRMVFHAYIRDAQISMTTLTNPSMSYAELTLPLPEAKELWFSKTASEWKPQFLQRVEAKRPPSLRDLLRDINLLSANLQRLDVQFAISIYLHGFWSLIWEWRQLDAVHRSTVQSPAASGNPNLLLASRHDELCKALKNFQLVTADWHEMLSAQECLVLNLLLMNMYVSLDDLQLFAGKEGEDQARRVYPILQKWSDSSEARQALWHAGQILRQAKLFPVGHLKDFYAIAVHHAALALWTHGVVTKARRPSTSPVGYEPVCLDGPDSSFVSRYIHFGHGRAVIRGPGCKEEAGSAENYLDAADPRACMDVAMETLRSNFIDGQDSLPPITENICQTLKQLGNAAWAVGLG